MKTRRNGGCADAWSQGCPLVGLGSGAALLEMPGSEGAVAHAPPPRATSTCMLAPRESSARKGAQGAHSSFTGDDETLGAPLCHGQEAEVNSAAFTQGILHSNEEERPSAMDSTPMHLRNRITQITE